MKPSVQKIVYCTKSRSYVKRYLLTSSYMHYGLISNNFAVSHFDKNALKLNLPTSWITNKISGRDQTYGMAFKTSSQVS